MCAARRQLDPLRLIEAAYEWHHDDPAWLKGIAEAARGLATSGASARLDDVSYLDRPRLLCAAYDRVPNRPWTAIISAGLVSLPPIMARALYAPGPPVGFARDRVRSLPAIHRAVLAATFAAWGWEDILGVFGRDVCGRVLHLDIGVKPRVPLHGRTVHRLACVAAHFTSALRLRLAEPPSPDAASTEAVLAPTGELHHATGDARRPSVRERLVRAARSADRARGPLRRRDPDAALALWKGLVDGTWSLVDHWDSDGRRFVLARRNAPEVADPKALTPSERTVVAFLALGYPEKYVAYLLGLSASTVATHFASARRKLALGSREELIALFASRAGAGTRSAS